MEPREMASFELTKFCGTMTLACTQELENLKVKGAEISGLEKVACGVYLD